DVLTDAEENVRQKLRAEGVMYCLKVKNVLALALVVRSRCEVLKASVKALVFGMQVVNNFNCRGFGPLLEDKLCLIFKLAPSVCRMTFPILASLLVRLVVLLPFQLLRLSLATPSRWTPLALSVFLHCVVALLLTLLDIFTFYVPHRHVYGEQWIKFMKDGVNATPLPTVNTTGYIDHAAFLGTINPDTNKIPKHLFQGYLNIYNNYFKAPWMPDRTEANPNELNQDDARYGFRCCH